MSEKRKLLALEKKDDTTPATSTTSLAQTQRDQKQMLYKRRRLTLMFIIAFVLFTFMGINLFRNGQHLLSLQQTHKEVKKEYADVKETKKDLENEVTLLKDPEYAQKFARSKYFYSKDGERVYSIPEFNSSNEK